MNRWREIWNNRQCDVEETDDIFETYVRLKKLDGWDYQSENGYYEGLFEHWEKMVKSLETHMDHKGKSVYEVCCGSGATLFLFEKIYKIEKTGGLDYSEPLLSVAKKVLKSSDLLQCEANHMDTDIKYEWVISDSGFQYFPDESYGLEVFGKCLEKSERGVYITDIHDIEKKEKHLAYRKSKIDDFDKMYEGLEKAYYHKEEFLKLAAEKGFNAEVIKPDNEVYWNNSFVYDVFCWK